MPLPYAYAEVLFRAAAGFYKSLRHCHMALDQETIKTSTAQSTRPPTVSPQALQWLSQYGVNMVDVMDCAMMLPYLLYSRSPIALGDNGTTSSMHAT